MEFLCGFEIPVTQDEEAEASPMFPQPGEVRSSMGSLGQKYSDSWQRTQPGPRTGAEEALLAPRPRQALHSHHPHGSSQSLILPLGLCSTVRLALAFFPHDLWALPKHHLLRKASQPHDPNLMCRGAVVSG